jgi:hypothetical protein
VLNRMRRLLVKCVSVLLFDGLLGANADERALIKKIKARNLTYLSNAKLVSIVTACRRIEKTDMPGIIVEAGCALGGSSILIATLKDSTRLFQVYDVFEMIPPPTDDDTADVHERYRDITAGKSEGIGGDQYYGYMQDLYNTVLGNFKEFGIDCDEKSISLIKGLVQDTMKIDQPVALAHIDVDWYEPVMTCLERIFPHLSIGGSIILDDYHDWGGCKKATDEFLATRAGQYTLDDSGGSLRVTRSALE